ncbi:MAG: macrocin O-methyltransferase [Spirochaetales bacterium]|nr:macrocin O-methyltransferase [Spirochaetales bacterium]
MTEEQAVALLKEKGWGLITPQTYLIDMEADFKTIWESVSPFTMISPERGYALCQALDYLEKNRIEGDMVECGVWRGGACMLAARLMMARSYRSRKIWLYDTFEGMTEPTEEDVIAASGQPVSERSPKGWWAVSREEVEQNLLSTGYDSSLWELVQGDVCQTLETRVPTGQIALLRLDTDWYESTKKEMEVLFPKLAEGGVLLLDDYGHFKGAAQGVDEYFRSLGIEPLLQRVDYTGRLYIKK